MHELQQILLQKLPRLGELTFWCEVQYWDEKMVYSHKNNDFFVFVRWDKTVWIDRYCAPHRISIIGHPFTHADILEALGEDWAMTGGYQLLHMHQEWMEFDITETYDDFVKLPTLPSNISDLSLPEYEETRKQLIQLLTK